MGRFLALILLSSSIFAALNVRACERHLAGHGGSADTNLEASRR